MQKFVLSVILLLAMVSQAVATESSLVGKWGAQEQIPLMGNTIPVQTTLVFTNGGTFSSLSSNPMVGHYQHLTGTYKTIPDKQMILVTIEDWEPKVFHGPLGDVPQAKPPGGLTQYSFPNAATLVLRDVGTGIATTYSRLP